MDRRKPLVLLGYTLIRLLATTHRIKYHQRHFVEQKKAQGIPIIFVTWHGEFCPFIFSHFASERLSFLVSGSRDGDIGAALLQKLGIQAIRGSSSRGGFKAMRDLIRTTRQGFSLAMTLDGPRAPRFNAKPGTVYLAKTTKCVIIPILMRVKPRLQLKTWDRFVIPLLFSRIDVLYCEPFQVTDHKDHETIAKETQELANRMLESGKHWDDVLKKKDHSNPINDSSQPGSWT